MAQTVANDMVKDKEKALKAAQNAKSKGGATIAEKIASEQERKANIQNAEQELAIWQAIASVPEARQQAYDEIVAAEEARRAEQNAYGREETVGLPVALEYLLEGGKGSIENAGYFLYGVQAAFPHIAAELQRVRDSIPSELLGMTPDLFVASNPHQLQEMRNFVAQSYGDKGVELFDKLIANSTGFFPREGKEVGLEIENLTPVEAQAEAEQGEAGDIKPIGKGAFGNIYDQFKGKAKEAIAFLFKRKEGEGVGALYHPEIGEIDLVWGKEGTGKSDGFGLAKLAKYHPEVLENLQEILNDMHVTQRSVNRVQLESDTHQAAVRLTWDNESKNWLLTAFEKKNSAFDNTTDTDETSDRGKQNDTATLQNTVSNGKDTTSSQNNNEIEDKNVQPTIGEQIQAAEAEVNINPTEAQKEAGNYKKGHVQIGTFDVTIEQPKGSVRSGVDKGGKKWEVEMQNTYGYIRGTEGVDGDHIDVFLSNDIDGWDRHEVFVVDQRNADGSFDEHKVMLGFNDINDAEAAYMSNYEEGWQGLGAITGVSIEDFEKWIASSHRKTKAFAEYKSVKTNEGQSASAEGVEEKAEAPTISQEREQVSDQDNAPYTIAPSQYTTKKGKVLDMHLVKFAGTLTKEQQRAAKELAKANKGWYDREHGGFMMRSEESAKQLADTILNNDDAVDDAQPVSLSDTREVVEEYKPNEEVSFSIREGNVASNTIATEVAVGMLKDAGVEVVEATDAMAEAVLAKGGVMMSMDSAPFYSNAKKAVLDIKQDKATPQQWVAMLKKNGGLKAGEDAWLGLESWLGGQTGSVTKQEIIDYIDEHAIEIEEVNYGESEVSQFEDSDIYNEWAELGGNEDAFNEMIERYGDDFEMAFLYDEGQLYVADEDAASFFIDKGTETINETRLSYTTEGLTDNREIALTVPTIEPYNQNDDIHFGDAGGGRAVAWVRFGETTAYEEIDVEQEVTEFNEPYKASNGHMVYKPKGKPHSKDFIVYGQAKSGKMIYVVYINEKQIPVAHATFEEARDAMNVYYKEHPKKRNKPLKVLVIDEIQSKRHQDGREKGYRNEEIIALENRINSLHEKMYGEGLAPEEYRELTRLREEQREIIINANPELKAESEKVKELEKEYEALKKDNQSKLDSEGVELARLQTLQEDARSIAEYDRIEKEIQDIKDAADKRKAELNEFFNVTIGNAYDKLHKGIRNDLSNQVYGVPVAPFEKNWHELAMKRMLRYAAENGYDKVAWTTGAQQAARYDMRKQVDNIQVEENTIEKFNDGTPIAKNITINTPSGYNIHLRADAEGNIRGGEYDGKNLKDVVGKELAEKIMQPGSFTIEEEGLAIGGEGMKGFYDKMLPSFVNKYAKKWGAKVGEVTMPSLEEGYQTMHSVDVTPQMKEDVMKGQPMFLRTPNGTVYGWTQGGKVFLTKEGMNAETPIHEYTHLWDKMVQQKNPELWNRGKELLKQTPTWNEVINDKNYANIAHDEDAVASEVHSRLSGENGAKVLEQMIKDARKDGAMAVAKAASITERIKEWIKDMFAALKETLSAWSKQDLADLSIEDFNNLTLRDLAEGVNPTEFVTEEGDMQFRAKRKSRALEIDESNLRQTKQEANSIIDKAVGIFVGGPKAAKAMRKQKEAERKALATEIYSKVLAGDFNPLTLQQIEKYINDVTPRNPFGNRISQRIPQEVERGVYGRESTSAIDLLFSRICESAVSAPRRFSEEGRREIEERKKEALKGWAIATGNWHTDLSEFTNDKEPFAQGTDSKVYTSKDGGYVIKASKGKPYGKRFRADIDNVALFNHIFPNSKYDIVGYGEIDGNFVRILRQPFVDFSQSDILTEEERVAYMAELGFKPLNKENTAFSNGDFVVADLQKANIVRDVTGNIRVIDADVKLHTTDTGGNYSYAPVEEDVLDDDVLYRSDDEMPNFKAKYGLSGVGPTAVIQNENDLIQLKKVVDVNTHQVLEDDFKAPRVYGSAYGNHNFIVIFLNKTTAPSYTSIWWHEAAHIAYRKLNLSNKEELGLHALEWMKRQGGKFRDHYDTIINIYDKSSWATEATARMIQCVVEDNGVEKFLNADFGGNEKLSNLAKAIKNVIIYGKEEPTERDILRHAEYNNRIHTTDSGRVGDGDRVSGGLSSAQHRSNQGRSREDSEGDSGNVRDIAERQGSGAVSDEGVTIASDPVSKAIGEPRYGRGKKMREYAERQRRFMVQKVQEIAQKLKLDNVEIVTDASTLSGKRAKAKGYFNPTTGKIVIVIPNHASVLDVEETVLHEAVAHYGLRKLFGKHFDTFLDNVYESADPEIRKKIAALAAKNGWDFRKATEEYLAMLAEDTEFESVTYTGWWFKVKELFRKMLDKLGLEDFAKEGLTLSDNELRYILFRSYQHLQGHRGLMFEAEDAVKQYELGVGNYSAPKVAESGEEGDYYRDGDFTPRDRVMARDHYERVVSSGSYQFREAVQDSMLGLRRLMESILPKTKIEEIAGSENAYIFENRMSSTNAGEQHVYFTRYMKPLLEEIGRICRASKVKREALTEYLMAKHGLERNEYMRKKDIEAKLNGIELTNFQKVVAEAYTTNANNLTIGFKDAKGKSRNIRFRQGDENKAGIKHSVFKHYQTNSNYFSADEVLLIPQILEKGKRKQSGKDVTYELSINDAIFTVTTEMSGMAEEFTNFFTNRKPTVEEQGSSNTENQHEQPQQSVSQREVTQNSANSNSEGEITRQGSGVISDEGVTMASDPVSKAIGEPRYGRGKKMREYAERQRRLMAQKLNLDNVEIVTDASTPQSGHFKYSTLIIFRIKEYACVFLFKFVSQVRKS